MAILRGRRRSDSAWLARDRGCGGRRPRTALTRHGPHGDDAAVAPQQPGADVAACTINPASFPSKRSPIGDESPDGWRRSHNRVSVVPAAWIRLALGAQKNGSDSAPGRFGAPVGVVKGRPQ
jgi:hypothetical protein